MKAIVTTFFLSFLSCCAFGQDKAAISAAEAGCGPDNVELSVTADESTHPTPSPENGKAIIYVVQRGAGTFKFGADGKWLGALKGGTYFHATVEPGEHHLCVKGHISLWKGLSLHHLIAKPGETYYFFVRVVAGGGYDELMLTQLDPDEGKELVARSRFISSHAKNVTSRNLSDLPTYQAVTDCRREIFQIITRAFFRFSKTSTISKNTTAPALSRTV